MVSKTFVGRTSELKKLEEYLTGVLKNKKGNVTFITGETGSGRTTLVEKFRDNVLAKEPKMRYAYTRCGECTGTSNPYAAFDALLEQLTKGKSKRVVFKFIEDHGADLLSGIPVIGGLASAGLKTAVWGKKIFYPENTMFQRYTKTLQNISGKNPLLLIVDDLQWSDDSSCGLLFHLARNIDEYPIFIIGIYCPSEIEATSHPMKQIRAEMDSKICNELPLGRLCKKNLIKYLNAEFPNNKFEAPFIDVLHDKTDGHPLFIVEVIKLLEDQKVIIKENDLWKLSQNISDIDIPTSVAGAINKRIEFLKNKSRRILRYAAIQGEVFTSVALSKLLDWQELSLLEELNVLVKIHKLIEELESEDLIRRKEGGYEFIHSFVHKSFYDDLGKREKELLHKKLGEILEELYKDDIYELAVDLAIHFEKGRVYNKSIDYRLKSAIKANDIHSCSEAIKHCNRALSLLEKTRHVTEEYTKKKMELLFELGRGKEFIGEWGDHEKELSVCDEILQIDEKLGNIIGKIHTLERQSWANRLLGNLSKAVTISEERLRIAEKTCNLHEIAEALQGVALLYRDIGKWEESINYCKEYIKSAKKLGAVPRHTIYNDLGFVYRAYA